MRSFCATLWVMLTLAVGGSIVYMLYGVLSQPVYAQEKSSTTRSGITRPGYIKPIYGSQKPVTVTKGYVQGLSSPDNTIRLKTYDRGTYTLTTGRIGLKTIRVKEYKKTP